LVVPVEPHDSDGEQPGRSRENGKRSDVSENQAVIDFPMREHAGWLANNGLVSIDRGPRVKVVHLHNDRHRAEHVRS
jgi:hypothetical protein